MANQTKYTPGPWIAKKGAGWYVSRPDAEARREAAIAVGMTPACTLVAGLNHPWFGDEEAQANAHLIAAAPEMLEALKAHDAYMLDTGYSGPEDSALHPKAGDNWHRVRAAIAKAEVL